MKDVIVHDHGSIIAFTILTRVAREWAEAYLPPDAPRMGDRTVCVERSFAPAVIEGMHDDGLRLSGNIYA